jgi:hypothetical protein
MSFCARIRAKLAVGLGALLGFQFVAVGPAISGDRHTVVVALDRQIYEARPAKFRQSLLRAQLIPALDASGDVDVSSDSEMTKVTIVVRNPTQHADLIDTTRRLLASRPQIKGEIHSTRAFAIRRLKGPPRAGADWRASALVAELRDASYLREGIFEGGVEWIVTDPMQRPDFEEWLDRRVAEIPDLDLTWTPMTVIQVTLPNHQIVKPDEPNALDVFWNISAPLVEMTDFDGGLAIRAKDPEFNEERGERVRMALAGRSDLRIETRPDQSLLIQFLSPPPKASLPDGARLLRAVRARLAGQGLRPLNVELLDPTQARIKFSTDAEARNFRMALENAYGFSVRMVDEPMDAIRPSESATAPSPGDQRAPLYEGGFLWLKPETLISGDMVKDSFPVVDPVQTTWAVHFDLNPEGRANFAAATEALIGRRLAFVLDGVVITAPRVNAAIPGGSGELICECSEATNAARARSLLRYNDDLPLRFVAE